MIAERNNRLSLPRDQVSIAFDLAAPPNNKGHIVRPGTYRLELTVTAAYAVPVKCVVEIFIEGSWYETEDLMLAHGVRLEVVSQ